MNNYFDSIEFSKFIHAPLIAPIYNPSFKIKVHFPYVNHRLRKMFKLFSSKWGVVGLVVLVAMQTDRQCVRPWVTGTAPRVQQSGADKRQELPRDKPQARRMRAAVRHSQN